MVKQSNYTVKLYIVGENAKETDVAANWAMSAYSGCTVVTGRGYWKDSTGRTIMETCNIIHINVFKPETSLSGVRQRVEAFMYGYMERANQEAVMYEINDCAYLCEVEKESNDYADAI